MTRIHTHIAGLIVAGALTGSVYAQGQPGHPCDGMGPMGMGGQAGPMGRPASMQFDPAQRAERHIGMLKGQLRLTAEQEPLWQAYADRMKAEAGKGLKAMRDQAANDKLSAPERMARMQSLMEERLTAMRSVHESFNRLYAALSPEQKAVADQHAAMMGRGPMRGPGRGMQPQG